MLFIVVENEMEIIDLKAVLHIWAWCNLEEWKSRWRNVIRFVHINSCKAYSNNLLCYVMEHHDNQSKEISFVIKENRINGCFILKNKVLSVYLLP